jgi:sigma-E factor negative regulatory protein RseC
MGVKTTPSFLDEGGMHARRGNGIAPEGVWSGVSDGMLKFENRDGAPSRSPGDEGMSGMREQGVVTRVIPPNIVEVSLQASEACGRCGACHPDSKGGICIEATAVAGVKTGDKVEIEISTGGVVTASFVVYLLPIVFMIAGYLLGSAAAGFSSLPVSGETGGIAGAILLLAVSFWFVRRYDRHIRRQGTLRAKVTRVLPQGDHSINTDPASLR